MNDSFSPKAGVNSSFLDCVQKVQAVQAVQCPSLVLPRVAGEETGGGWNDLNYLNEWNLMRHRPIAFGARVAAISV
jgi:hypothetical protein